MGKDISDRLLGDCSPYISSMYYDVTNRELCIEFMDNVVNREPYKRIRCVGVLKYQEIDVEDEPDDDCLDDLLGIDWSEQNILCIKTHKKEIILITENDPISELIERSVISLHSIE